MEGVQREELELIGVSCGLSLFFPFCLCGLLAGRVSDSVVIQGQMSYPPYPFSFTPPHVGWAIDPASMEQGTTLLPWNSHKREKGSYINLINKQIGELYFYEGSLHHWEDDNSHRSPDKHSKFPAAEGNLQGMKGSRDGSLDIQYNIVIGQWVSFRLPSFVQRW